MAISWKSTGAASFLQNTFSPVVPAGHAAGDLALLLAGGKPFGWATGTNPVAQGFTSLGSFSDGTTAASGADVGSMRIEAWYKIFPGGAETATLTETGTWDVVGGLVMIFQKAGGDTWDTPAFVGGGDASAGTGFSVTCNANPGITAGDAVVSFGAFRSDAATPCSSHITPTATGATFTNTHDPATDPETTTGFDMGMCVTRSTLTGTASAAPVLAATLAAAHTGSAGLIRLRLFVPAPHIYIPVGYAMGRDY